MRVIRAVQKATVEVEVQLGCHFLGSVKSLISALFVSGTFPIDLAKTRLQVQGQVGDSKYREIRYRGMLHALLRVGREEGLRALYSGSV